MAHFLVTRDGRVVLRGENIHVGVLQHGGIPSKLQVEGDFFTMRGARKSPALSAVCKEFSNYSAKDMSVSTRLAKDRSYG